MYVFDAMYLIINQWNDNKIFIYIYYIEFIRNSVEEWKIQFFFFFYSFGNYVGTCPTQKKKIRAQNIKTERVKTKESKRGIRGKVVGSW